MIDKEHIKNALEQLDPFDDSQWTSDGAPRIEVVSSLVGEIVKRQDIVEAAPDFNRSNFSSQVEPEPEAEAEPQPEVKVVENFSFPDKYLTIDEFRRYLPSVPVDRLEEFEAHLKAQRSEVREKIDELLKIQGYLSVSVSETRIRFRSGLETSENQHAIRAFIDSQNAAKAAKVQQRKELLAGLDLKEIDPRAPIDVAMARKTKRGTQRPARPLMK